MCARARGSMDDLCHLEPLLSNDPKKLAEASFKCGAISAECKEALDDLDSSTNTGTIARYLLMHVCRKIKDDRAAYQKFFRTLSEIFRIDLPLIQGRSKLGIQNFDESVVLTEWDISDLTEALNDVAHRWKQLGLALKLSEAVRQNCESSDCVLSLSNVLQAWMRSSKDPCKLKVLIQALESKTVSNSNAAQSLRQNYIDRMGVSEKYLSKSDNLSNSYIKFCSLDMNVAEGKSVLIEAQYTTSILVSFQWTKDKMNLVESFRYHGVQDNILMIADVDLAHAGKYQCLILDSSRNRIAVSDQIEVKVTLSAERQYLMSLYSSEFEPIGTWPPISTTKFINLALVNNYGTCEASYKHTIRGDSDDIIRAKTGTEYKEVFKKIKEGLLILVEGRPGSGKTTLARKICKDWAKDGSILKGSRMVFFIYLRLLSDKDKNLEDVLGRLFFSDSSQREELNSIVHNLVKSKGKKSCFVLDGLDEYDLSNRRDTFIYKLIFKKFLPEAAVVIFSRPVATHSLRSSREIKLKRVEILGFSNNQILDYILHYPFPVTSPGVLALPHANLLKHLLTHSNVMHMCYLPVHMAMICFIYQMQGDNIPRTESKIYEMFTILTIIRHQNRESSESDLEIESLKHLEGDLLNKFKALCKSAYENTVSAKQILDHSDIPSDAHTLGLVTLDKVVSIYKMKKVHTFHHLTFQEYLAAWHIAGLEEECQLKIVQHHGSNPHMKNVWKYYCGITNFENKMEQFISLISSHTSDTIYTIQCAFESQEGSSVCLQLAQNQTEPCVFVFVDHVFSPYDVCSLEYVLVNAFSERIHLKLEKCTFDANFEAESLPAVSSLLIQNHFKESPTDLTFLNKMINLVELDIQVVCNLLDLKKITLPFLKIIRFMLFSNSDYCISQEQLQALRFNSTLIQEVSAYSFQDFPGEEEENQFYDRMRCMAVVQSELCSIFGFPAVFRGNLPSVSVYNYKICSFKSIESVHYKKCTSLSLINCDIDNEIVTNLAEGLCDCINLTYLNLDFNSIEDDGALAIAVSMKSLVKLKFLSVNGNYISDVGAIKLVDSLTSCSALNFLELQGNMISLEGVKNIVMITEDYFPKLKLHIWNKNLNFVESSTFKKFTENSLDICGIRLGFLMDRIPGLVSVNLQVLNVSLADMYLCDLSNLVSCLSCCKNLKKINMSRNCFFWNDVKNEPLFHDIMKELFRNCPLIEYIDMSHNDLCIDCLEEMSLSSLENLHYLDLSQNRSIFNWWPYSQIHEIGKCGNLCTLLLNGCCLSCTSLAYILKKCQNICTIGLAGIQELQKDFASFILLLAASQLKSLNISETSFTQESVFQLASLFEVDLYLEILSIKLCRMSEESFASLCSFHWNCLHTLDVSFNHIGSANIDALTFSLKYCFTQLNTLNICSNKIGDKAMEALQESLGKRECSLQSLDISRNELGDEGTEVVMLICNKLEFLDVSYNRLTSVAIEMLNNNSTKLKDVKYENQNRDH